MPFPIAPLITAGASLLGTALSTRSTNRANRENREYADMAYNRERTDNLKFWQMQNDYNSPESQMGRMKSAGLNPLLPFVGGSGLGASQAAPIKTADTKPYSHQTPDFSGVAQAGQSAIQTMYQLDLQKAQLDNLKAQNSNILTDTALKATNAIKSKTDTEGSLLRNRQFGALIDTNVQAASEALRQAQLQNQTYLQRHEMQMAQGSSTMAEAVERIALSKIEQSLGKYKAQEYRERIKTMVQQQKLNDFEIKLNQFGQTKNDDMIYRMLSTLLQSTMENLGLGKFLN